MTTTFGSKMSFNMTKEEAEFIVLQYLDQGLLDVAEDYAQKWGLNLADFGEIKVYSDDEYDPS
jgi:hypothetical protein